MFDPRLPWAISCGVCAVLALTSSSQANSYQASIDTALYQQSGDLKVAWMKPPDGVMSSGMSLLAIAGSVYSLYQVLNLKPTQIGQPDSFTFELPTVEDAAPNATKSEAKRSQATAKQDLLNRLKIECPALLKLVKSHPIRAVGAQRTGKTTLVKKLALLRLLLLPKHQLIASTPHYEPDNAYPSLFKTVGNDRGRRDYAAISREWSAMANRIAQSKQSSITTVWDEFGLMDQVMEEEQVATVLTSSLREASKHGEYPIFICHGETAAFLPGAKGLVTVFLSSTVRVETIGELIEDKDGLDEMRPTGKFRITWLDGSKDEGQIPSWLTEELLISLAQPTTKHGKPKQSEPKQSEQSEPESTVPTESESEDPWEE